MGKKYKKITTITIIVFSILLILIHNLESALALFTNVTANVYFRSDEAFKILLESFASAFNSYFPVYLRQTLLTIITLIGIPLCLKYKESIVSKISIVLVILLSLLDVICLNIYDLSYTSLYGFISIFILIYSIISSIFIFKKIKL